MKSELTQIVEANLEHLMLALPIAIELGKLEHWCQIYAEGYILKLRSMK